jgi:hypothetical protein
VQDSYYKDVHIDLATIVAEMASEVGWVHDETIDYPVARTKAALHPGVRRYRKSFEATESLIVLRAPS